MLGIAVAFVDPMNSLPFLLFLQNTAMKGNHLGVEVDLVAGEADSIGLGCGHLENECMFMEEVFVELQVAIGLGNDKFLGVLLAVEADDGVGSNSHSGCLCYFTHNYN